MAESERKESLRSMFRQAIGAPDPIGAAYGPSTIESFTPVAVSATAEPEPSDDQFKKPLLRVSIQTGQVLESRLAERKEVGVTMKTAAANGLPKGKGPGTRYDWNALRPRIIELHAKGLSVSKIVKGIGLPWASQYGQKVEKILAAAGLTPHDSAQRRARKAREHTVASHPGQPEENPTPVLPPEEPAAEDVSAEFDPIDHSLLELDEEAETPEAIITAYQNWLEREAEIVDEITRELKQAMDMHTQATCQWGVGRETADLLRTIRRIISVRIRRILEAI